MAALGEVAARRRDRARRQAIEAPGSNPRDNAEREAALEGARAGARRRAREKALDVVGIAAALEREGLTDPRVEALLPEAVETLAKAESVARHRGAWTPRDDARMTIRDLTGVVGYAVAATRRRLTLALPRMARPSDDEYQDLHCDLVRVALERGRAHEPHADAEDLPLWAALEARPERETERRIAALWMRGGTDAMAAAERAAERALSDPLAARGAWRAYLTAHARTWARRRREEAMAALEAGRAAADPADLQAERIAYASATAAEDARMIALALDLSERAEYGVRCALDGLTDRERATSGVTPAAARKRRQRAQADLLEILPTPDAVRDALELALAQEAERERMPEGAREAIAEDDLRRLMEAARVDRPAKHRIPGATPTIRDHLPEREHAPVVIRHMSTCENRR